MFRMVRFFSIASLLAFTLLTIVLSEFYRRIAVEDLIRVGESKNVAITQTFANSLRSQLPPFIADSSGLTPEELRTRQSVADLREAVFNQMSGQTIAKVKVYSARGLTVFSTEPEEIGEDEELNQGFLSALAGVPASELTHRDTFSAFDREMVNRDLLSTYIPIRDGGKIVGVFEVYDDVTPLLVQVADTQRRVTVVVIISLAVLYLILLAIVARAQAEIRRQQRELIYSDAKLNAVLNTVGEGIVTVDPTGSIVSHNQHVRDLWGYSAEELDHGSLSKLLADKDWDSLFATIKRYLESDDMKGFGERIHLQAVKQNGAEFPVEARVVETQVGEEMLLFTIALHEATVEGEQEA